VVGHQVMNGVVGGAWTRDQAKIGVAEPGEGEEG
jgi:hypothetical protein